MQLRECVQSIVNVLPTDSSVTLPVSVLRKWLGICDERDIPNAERATPEIDLTIADAAQAFGRGESTIRSWCATGLIPGCYRLRGREWRIPRQGLSAFLEGQREGASQPQSISSTKVVDIAAWRTVSNT